jgi:hypothetical protein
MRRLDHAQQRGLGHAGAGGRRRSFGRRRGHGQDGPLDRPHHGPAGQVGRVPQGIGQHLGLHTRLGRLGHALGHPPQELGEDDPRIAPGPHQRAVADGLAHLGQVRPGVDLGQLGHHGFGGQGHVGAGVAIGHGIDIEPVDVRLVQAQPITKALHHRTQLVGAQYRQGGHAR